ncbi:cell division protein FtsZ [Novimethylophilus kurashikiensis]|uniref:Cell division protein FtsZ n=1 Tax=Novimethylophilus kurashikiensis TaxID=1825523 RepID=A0A2R5FAV9_9PROT|nr:cell division protein FtsZ [Novimethylophilus kurashikiensis]GBG15372.1 cell division protein FtsZ [Novimethylophilus kurashikiensis]
MSFDFEIVDRPADKAVIKVMGVGGCGGNAVEHMIDMGVSGVEFISANTDMGALKRSRSEVQLQLGASLTRGLGAGGKPDVGREAALEDRDRIAETIEGADMLFIAAGMGGGTGTGAAPVVAEVAKEMGILTVAVVTKPFSFENNRKMLADDGISMLSKSVDSLLIVPNERLMQVLGGRVTLKDAYRAANGVLHNAVSGIAEIINGYGMVNVDFADVRTVMGENGMAMMGSASASGENRARIAAEQAVNSPFLENVNLKGARGVLVNISASEDSFMMDEFYEVMNTIKEFTAEDASVYFGNVFDNSLGDDLRITLVATGLSSAASQKVRPTLAVNNGMANAVARTGTHDEPIIFGGAVTSEVTPAVMVSNRRAQADMMRGSGIEEMDIPAFLRKQAD